MARTTKQNFRRSTGGANRRLVCGKGKQNAKKAPNPNKNLYSANYFKGPNQSLTDQTLSGYGGCLARALNTYNVTIP